MGSWVSHCARFNDPAVIDFAKLVATWNEMKKTKAGVISRIIVAFDSVISKVIVITVAIARFVGGELQQVKTE